MRTDLYGEPEQFDIWLKQYKQSQSEKIKSQLRDLMVMTYLPFVKKLSHGLARRSTDPVEDLIQVGSLGLLKALDQYQEDFGTSFKTYATYLITGEIRHYLRDKVTIIKAPRELRELSYRINRIIQELTNKLGQTPDNTEIANQLQIPVSRVDEVIEVDRRKQLLSLDQVISGNSENEQSLGDKLVDNKYNDFQLIQEDRIMLSDAINELDKGLKDVVEMSFFEDLSQIEIAQKLGISQMQVSRRLKKALAELFEIITSKQEKIENAL
ncbi:MAG: sigma-70 family RNA polymerase sigma factor [Candidatus Gastranaerophilales bacterium]|nr:sigma-70 family RNA polymerase sigma factor [Candidatus Gastranaerophilales bacterium]